LSQVFNINKTIKIFSMENLFGSYRS